MDEETPILANSRPKSPFFPYHRSVNDDEKTLNDDEKIFSKATIAVVICVLMTELCERLTYYSVVANLVLYCTNVLDLSSSTAATVSLVFSDHKMNKSAKEDTTLLISTPVSDKDDQIPLPLWKTDRMVVVVCILCTELCERLTYYSVVANLVLYCESVLNYETSTGTSVSLVFSGTVYLIPVIGGYIADTISGKYNAILGSGLIYILGLFLLPASAVDYTSWFDNDADGNAYDLSVEMRRVYFFMGLVFVAIGTGGIKANVGPFGAQQVEDLGPDAVQSFFNWFYWFINAGSFVAYLGVAYVQQNISFGVGFLIPLISMIIALVIFVAVRKKYIMTPPGGSIILDSVGVCVKAKCWTFDRSRKSRGGPYSDELVSGVICVLRIMPVFLLIILYWAIYSQMQSTFFLQGERMNAKIGSITTPIAALNVFNTVIILILIPIVDRLIYPQLAKIGRSPTHLQRIGFGFVLSCLSVVVAGIVEIYRKQDLEATGGMVQTLSEKEFNASTISLFIQIPEFALVGASEVFASISGLEFAYSQAPDFMQGLCMGLFLMMSGLGNYVSELILEIVKAATGTQPPDSWFPEEINEGKTEYLFFLLGGLMALNTVAFYFIAKCYKYKKTGTDETLDAAEKGHKNDAYTKDSPVIYSAENESTKL